MIWTRTSEGLPVIAHSYWYSGNEHRASEYVVARHGDGQLYWCRARLIYSWAGHPLFWQDDRGQERDVTHWCAITAPEAEGE